MPFDATKPADNSPIVSAELRNQFVALKQFINTHEATIQTLQAQVAGLQTALAGKASAINTVDTLNTDIDNPVTAEQGQACSTN